MCSPRRTRPAAVVLVLQEASPEDIPLGNWSYRARNSYMDVRDRLGPVSNVRAQRLACMRGVELSNRWAASW